MGRSVGVCIRPLLRAVAGMLLLSSGAAHARTSEVLSLDQLIQMALEKSPELEEAEQDVIAAQSELQQAGPADGHNWT